MLNFIRRFRALFSRTPPQPSQSPLPESETGLRFDQLHDFALDQVFLRCDAEEIEALQSTCKKFSRIIKRNRLFYSKTKVQYVGIKKRRMGRRTVKIAKENGAYKKRVIKKGALNATICSYDPEILYTFDHDELINMSWFWWKDRRTIFMWDTKNYLKYSALFDPCTNICISATPGFRINLAEFLKPMTTKNLEEFTIYGKGELECTDEDLLTIGRLSNKMCELSLDGFTESSKITSDGVLDMIEIGSFEDLLFRSKIQDFENMGECLQKRKWVLEYKCYNLVYFKITTINGSEYRIKL